MKIWIHTLIKMSSRYELAVSFLWFCNSHSELTTTTAWWAHRVISQIAHSKLTVSVANSQKGHSKLTVWVILRVHCEATECPHNELSVGFNVSSQWVSCELKFFTGKLYHRSLTIFPLRIMNNSFSHILPFQRTRYLVSISTATRTLKWRSFMILKAWVALSMTISPARV